MNLLDNELVKTYFGCEPLTTKNCYHDYHQCDQAMAHRVLTAMQEIVQTGEKYCLWDRWLKEISGPFTLKKDEPAEPYKMTLRLPDAFQTHEWKEASCRCRCCLDANCKTHNNCIRQPKAEKICPRCHKPENQFGHTMIEKTEYGETACIHMPQKPDPTNYVSDPVEESDLVMEFLSWFMNDIGKRNPNGVTWAYGEVRTRLRELVAMARK